MYGTDALRQIFGEQRANLNKLAGFAELFF